MARKAAINIQIQVRRPQRPHKRAEGNIHLDTIYTNMEDWRDMKLDKQGGDQSKHHLEARFANVSLAMPQSPKLCPLAQSKDGGVRARPAQIAMDIAKIKKDPNDKNMWTTISPKIWTRQISRQILKLH